MMASIHGLIKDFSISKSLPYKRQMPHKAALAGVHYQPTPQLGSFRWELGGTQKSDPNSFHVCTWACVFDMSLGMYMHVFELRAGDFFYPFNKY